MYYSQDTVADLNKRAFELVSAQDPLVIRLLTLSGKLKNQSAKDHLMQGASRRIKILARCIENLFRIFPPDQSNRLSSDALSDLNINLHAFVVNTAGIFDNLAWAFVEEHELELDRKDIGLFMRKTQIHFPKSLCDYLESEHLQAWRTEYLKNYRDALAHRIPLYIPPYTLNAEETVKFEALMKELKMLDLKIAELHRESDIDRGLEIHRFLDGFGSPCPAFAHSPEDGGKPTLMHPQVLADFATIEEIVNAFCDFSGLIERATVRERI